MFNVYMGGTPSLPSCVHKFSHPVPNLESHLCSSTPNSVYHRPSVICATTIINNCSCLHNAYPGHNFIKYCAL